MGSRTQIKLEECSAGRLHQVLDSVPPICVTGFDHRILATNLTYRSTFGDPGPEGLCHLSRPGPSCFTDVCPLVKVEQGAQEFSCEVTKVEGSVARTFIITARPLLSIAGAPIGIVESFQDITRRKELEDEQKRLIQRLESALAEVRALRGLLPICSACKKIRDEDGHWSEIETYVAEHTNAEFTHGMCPACKSKYYPEHFGDD